MNILLEIGWFLAGTKRGGQKGALHFARAVSADFLVFTTGMAARP